MQVSNQSLTLYGCYSSILETFSWMYQELFIRLTKLLETLNLYLRNMKKFRNILTQKRWYLQRKLRVFWVIFIHNWNYVVKKTKM